MHDLELRRFALELAVKADAPNALALADQFYVFLTTKPSVANYSQAPNFHAAYSTASVGTANSAEADLTKHGY